NIGNMRTRIVLDIMLVLAVFALPLWLVCPAAIIFLFLFENFYEIIIVGIIIDSLYGVPLRFFPIPVIYTASASFLFIARSFLKKHLRF
ncbi:MAG: hypothetical protein Q7R65_00220, partial [bacterium]|nr:hypothetical protein [bacterium]